MTVDDGRYRKFDLHAQSIAIVRRLRAGVEFAVITGRIVGAQLTRAVLEVPDDSIGCAVGGDAGDRAGPRIRVGRQRRRCGNDVRSAIAEGERPRISAARRHEIELLFEIGRRAELSPRQLSLVH